LVKFVALNGEENTLNNSKSHKILQRLNAGKIK